MCDSRKSEEEGWRDKHEKRDWMGGNMRRGECYKRDGQEKKDTKVRKVERKAGSQQRFKNLDRRIK